VWVCVCSFTKVLISENIRNAQLHRDYTRAFPVEVSLCWSGCHAVSQVTCKYRPETASESSAETAFGMKSFFCLILLLCLGQSSTIH